MSKANEAIRERLRKIRAAREVGSTTNGTNGTNDSPKTETVADRLRKVAESKVTIPTPSQTNLAKPTVVSLTEVGEDEQYIPFKHKLMELEEALDQESSDFAQLLREIYNNMSTDQNVVTILSPQEIGLIVKGFIKHTDTTITTAKPKSTRRTQPVSIDDI